MRIELTGVPETLLWNLWNRAAEARRPDSVLEDPRAVELVDEIDYPFDRFGGTGMAQWHALRVLAFDREVRRFLTDHPGGTVVALGEGLETQFWRVDDGRLTWLSVDLPETVTVRRALLPDEPPRRTSLPCSALDPRWMAEVDASRGVLITAQGLLMYLQPSEVEQLLATCAERFPGGTMLFDALSRSLVERSKAGPMSGQGGYRAPAWQWSLEPGDTRTVAALSPGIGKVREVRLPRGRGPLVLAPWLHRVPLLGRNRMWIVRVSFVSP